MVQPLFTRSLGVGRAALYLCLTELTLKGSLASPISPSQKGTRYVKFLDRQLLKETVQSRKRKQDTLNPQKYSYIKPFDDLAEANTHIIAIALSRFSEGPDSEPVPNSYIVTAYQIEIG